MHRSACSLAHPRNPAARPFYLLSALILIAVDSVEAGVNRWTHTGPAAGVNTRVLIDPVVPTILYALGAGLFQSLDAGTSWQFMIQRPPPEGTFPAITVSPEAPGTLYTRPDNGVPRIFKSVDGGSTWRELVNNLQQNPLRPLSILDLTPVRTTPPTLYAGMSRNCFLSDCIGGGVFKSADGGTQWTLAGLDGHVAYRLVAPLANPTLIYGKNDNEFFRSGDGGRTWTIVASPNTSHGDPSSPMAAAPTEPATIYLGHFRSVFRSSNGGTTWTRADLEQETGIEHLVVDPRNAESAYVGTAESGVFRSVDGGRTWTQMNAGLTSLSINSLAIDDTGTRLYAGTGDGIFAITILENRPAIQLPLRPPGTRIVTPRN